MPASLAPLLASLIGRLLHVEPPVLARRAPEPQRMERVTYARRSGTATIMDRGEGKAHPAEGSMNARETFFGSPAPTDPKKVPEAFEDREPPFWPHEEVGCGGCPKGARDVELEAPESGPFRSTASLLAKSGAGRRRLALSLHFELMADARTLPL